MHKAPANAVIRGIRLQDGIAQDVTKRHQDLLNPRGINALRFFPQFGHRVWGARTLSSDSSWKYVNVRRLFIYLEESIDEGTQWVVFEPNDEALWALVRQSVTNFLTTVWRNGALAGTTADEAFFVACDRTTMTEDDLAERPAHLRHRRRAGVPGGVRDLPDPAEDPRGTAHLSRPPTTRRDT